MPTTPRSLRRVRSGITSLDFPGFSVRSSPDSSIPSTRINRTHNHTTRRIAIPQLEPEFRLLFNRAANAAVLVLSQSRGGPDENDPRNPGDPPDEIPPVSRGENRCD